MATGTIIRSNPNVTVIQGSKVATISNSNFYYILTKAEIESAVGFTINNMSQVAEFVCNGDWDAIHVKVVATAHQNNNVIAFFDQAYNVTARLNYMVAVTRS